MVRCDPVRVQAKRPRAALPAHLLTLLTRSFLPEPPRLPAGNPDNMRNDLRFCVDLSALEPRFRSLGADAIRGWGSWPNHDMNRIYPSPSTHPRSSMQRTCYKGPV